MSSRFFRSSSTEIVIPPTLANSAKKHDSPRLIEKNDSRRGQETVRSRFKKEALPNDADRTFPNRHHPNIIKGLNRKYNSRHRPL